MRIAFAGVAHSHPFMDAANLRVRGAAITGVWDPDDPGRRDAFAEQFGVPIASSLADLLADGADAIVATPRTPRAASVATDCAAAGIPAFFNKTVAADAAGITAWEAVEHSPRFTSSVLRFSPALQTFAAGLSDVPLRALEVHAQHDIAGFLTPARSWQDDPAGAGGTLINIGVHAWEMIDVLRPGARVEILSAVRTRGAVGTASEVLGSVHARLGEVALSVTVSGVGDPDRYAITAWTDDGAHELVLADDADALGYGGAADAVIALAQGEPVPFDGTRTGAVYRNAVEAAAMARS